MKVVIFGGAGGTGRVLVEQALEKGYEVTAFDRHPQALTIQHPKLSYISDKFTLQPLAKFICPWRSMFIL